jgi:hypothetical protein
MSNARIACAVVALTALMSCRLDASVGTLKADTYVSSANPSTNFGASTLINIGAGNSGLLQFDLSPIVSQLLTSVNPTPSSVAPIIGKATLTVFVNKAATAGTLTASPLLNSWTESTVTNSTLPSVGPTVGNTAVSAGGQFVTIDVTPIVQGWLSSNNDPSSPNYVGGGNFGIHLASPDGGVFILDTKEGTTTSHAASLDIDLATDFTGVLHKNLSQFSSTFWSANLMSIHLTGTNAAGGRIYYTIRATDGGSAVVGEEGVIQFLATANSITCSSQPTDKVSLGGLTSQCSVGFFNPGFQPGVGIFDTPTFFNSAPAVVNEIFFRIENLSGAVIRLEP